MTGLIALLDSVVALEKQGGEVVTHAHVSSATLRTVTSCRESQSTGAV